MKTWDSSSNSSSAQMFTTASRIVNVIVFIVCQKGHHNGILADRHFSAPFTSAFHCRLTSCLSGRLSAYHPLFYLPLYLLLRKSILIVLNSPPQKKCIWKFIFGFINFFLPLGLDQTYNLQYCQLQELTLQKAEALTKQIFSLIKDRSLKRYLYYGK